jgi:hypothetical protein
MIQCHRHRSGSRVPGCRDDRAANLITADHMTPAAMVQRHRHGSQVPGRRDDRAAQRHRSGSRLPGCRDDRHGSRLPRSIDTDHQCPVAMDRSGSQVPRMDRAANLERVASVVVVPRLKNHLPEKRFRRTTRAHFPRPPEDPPNLERVAQDDPTPSPSKWITVARLPRSIEPQTS